MSEKPAAGQSMRLLKESRDRALFYAVQIIELNVDKIVWRDLLFDRLNGGFDSGTKHVLAALAASDVDLPPITAEIVEGSMKSTDSGIVEAGAKLGTRWVATGGTIDAGLAEAAYHAAIARDRSANGSRLYTEVRAELLKLLIVSGSLDDALLAEARADTDVKARTIADEEWARRGTDND